MSETTTYCKVDRFDLKAATVRLHRGHGRKPWPRNDLKRLSAVVSGLAHELDKRTKTRAEWTGTVDARRPFLIPSGRRRSVFSVRSSKTRALPRSGHQYRRGPMSMRTHTLRVDQLKSRWFSTESYDSYLGRDSCWWSPKQIESIVNERVVLRLEMFETRGKSEKIWKQITSLVQTRKMFLYLATVWREIPLMRYTGRIRNFRTY